MTARGGCFREWLGVAGLAVLGSWIWLRDLSWMVEAENTLPILVGFVLLWWIGAPWKRREAPIPHGFVATGIWLFLFLAGVATGLTTLLALGWVSLFGRWMYCRFECVAPGVAKLCLLAFCSFPWLAVDLTAVGWWFRLTGSWATSCLYGGLGFFVQLQGTTVAVEGVPIDVAEACSGMNVLQSMLLAGSAVAVLECPNGRRFYSAVFLLPVIAWIANTLRIVLLTAAGLTAGPDFASGWFHTWGSMVVILTISVLSWVAFRTWEVAGLRRWWSDLMERRAVFSIRLDPREKQPWLVPVVVVLFAGFSCADLLSSWFDDPFNKMGGLAMAIWLAAVMKIVAGAYRKRVDVLRRYSMPMVVAGLSAVTVGNISELNVLQHGGFVCVVASLLPSFRSRLVMACLSISWMPVYGWIGATFLQWNLDGSRAVLAALGFLPCLVRPLEAPVVCFKKPGLTSDETG